MRILLSTTLGHNPGDEIIALGVLNLIKHGLKVKDLEIVLYNRNPDLQQGSQRCPRPSIGNYVTDEIDFKALGIDAVVLAGSPEFTGGPMEPLYNALIAAPHVPMYALGVGLTLPNQSLSNLDIKALRRYNTYIVTRSQEATDFLKKEYIASKPMVCPALFCTMLMKSSSSGEENMAIVQAPGCGWHEVTPSYLHGVEKINTVTCFHVKELKYFNSIGKDTRFLGTPGSIIDKMLRTDTVVSTRLHGAIAALACGARAIVVGRGDYRIETVAKMYGDFLPIVGDFNEHPPLKAMDEIKEFKWHHWNLWIEELKSVWA